MDSLEKEFPRLFSPEIDKVQDFQHRKIQLKSDAVIRFEQKCDALPSPLKKTLRKDQRGCSDHFPVTFISRKRTKLTRKRHETASHRAD